MLKIMRPNMIFIVIEAICDMNEIRRSFLGEPKASPNLLQGIKKILFETLDDCDPEDEMVVPIHFSIIKKPVSIYIEGIDKPRVSKKGVGAMILYEYLGRSDELKLTIDTISNYLENKLSNPPSERSWMASITEFGIILGKKYIDIKE